MIQFTWGPTSAYISSHADGISGNDNPFVVLYSDDDNYDNVNACLYGRRGYEPNTTTDCENYWPPGITVTLKIYADSTIVSVSMGIIVSNVTKDAAVKRGQVITGSQPIVITDEWEYGRTYVYASTSPIVLSVVTPYARGLDSNPNFFDSVFVYEGQGPNATFFDSVRDLERGTSHMLSSSSVTFFVTGQPTSNVGKVFINNQQNVAVFTYGYINYHFPYNGERAGEGITVGLGSEYASSIVCFNATFDYPIIEKIWFSDNSSVMQLYSGLVSNKMAENYIKQFTNATVSSMAPQPYAGTAYTFTITKGYATITLNGAMNAKPIG